MQISILVNDKHYSDITINKWKTVWSSICEMAYNGNRIQHEIITKPGCISVDHETTFGLGESDHTDFYAQQYCDNETLLTLEHTWKQYSQKEGAGHKMHTVPEFQRLHVPECLYYTLGVKNWFAECFPNCQVTYWNT